LGEAVEIGPPTSLVMTRESGRNVLVVAPPESTDGVLASMITGAAAMARRAYGAIELFYFDGSPIGQESFATWLDEAAIGAIVVKPRESEQQIAAIAEEVRSRVEQDQTDLAPKLVVINPLNRFSDFKQDESFSFSLDAAAKISGSAALQSVLRDGPAVGIFTIICCSSAETVSRWLPRQSRHDLQQRIIGRVNASDSAALIDSAEAANLSPATMLIYDDADGTFHKFRACDLPSPQDIQSWLSQP
jgi:S-DNA-T family DNA segregation ATPase FtsK/SpoIIIE